MILQRALRPQPGLRAVSSCRQSFLRSSIQARYSHSVPQLLHDRTFKEEGIPDLMSPDGYEMAWTQYQGFLLEKLNMLTAGTPDEDVQTGNLIVKYAHMADMASLFNYASMSHNNHFFFSCISPKQVPIPKRLEDAINDSCSSVDSLRAEFLATGNAMFGPGFVWLVKVKETGALRTLSTYNAGSPYPAAHFRRQPVDMATHSRDIDEAYPTATRTYGAVGRHSGQPQTGSTAADIHPILCVNTWEHVWLRDWGVTGKAGFLEAWWDRINWDEVQENFSQVGPDRVAHNPSRRQRLI